MVLQAKESAYSYKWGYSYKYYINVNALLNADNTGLIQLITPMENRIFDKADKMINSWENIDYNQVKDFYKWIDAKVPEFYKNTWNIIPN